MTNGEQVAKILADILDGCPLVDPCNKIWALEGWCKDHCKPGQQEPDSECWLKYAEAMVKEAENSNKSSLTQNTLDVPDTNVGDTISRQAAIAAVLSVIPYDEYWEEQVEIAVNNLPSAQPEPLSDAYIKAVWTWLLNYQIKAAELKGRYTPYEVLSWVANDWRKEHEGSD